MKRWLLVLLSCSLLLTGACSHEEPAVPEGLKRLQVVTTLFPLYDFARAIGGDRADVSLLLPPGVEPHSFDPQPDDILRINHGDIFAYTNPAMEPWAVRIAASVDAARVKVVDASRGISLRKGPDADGHQHGHDHSHGSAEEVDPHLWLDLANAAAMVGNLAGAMSDADPGNRDFSLDNARHSQEQLARLDDKYRAALAGCTGRALLHCGHLTFGYLADRYGLDYRAAAGINPEAEPTPAKLADLVRLVRTNRLSYVFSEEMASTRLAETIARETGAGILPLNAAHTVSREAFASGVTFLEIMERNLVNLVTGLGCR